MWLKFNLSTDKKGEIEMSAETLDVYTSGGTLLVVGEGVSFWSIRRRLVQLGDEVLGAMQTSKEGSEAWAMRVEPDDPTTCIEDVLLSGRLARREGDTESAAVHYVELGDLDEVAAAVSRRLGAINE